MTRFITEKEFIKLVDSVIKKHCVIERMYKAGSKRIIKRRGGLIAQIMEFDQRMGLYDNQGREIS
jgi:hypothetical protein